MSTYRIAFALGLLVAPAEALAQEAAAPSVPVAPVDAPRPRILHTPPGVAENNQNLALRFAFSHVELIDHVVVSWRPRGAPVWQSVTCARDEETWRAEIPAQPAGVRAVEYHVTTFQRQGEPIAAFATREHPHVVVLHLSDDDEQERRDLVANRGMRLEFLAGAEYTDFGAHANTGASGCGMAAGAECRDWWYLLYGQVRYRFHRRVRSVTVRVERLDGVTTRTEGGNPVSRSVGLVSATTEVEFRLAPWVSASLLGILGANEQSVQAGGGARLELGTGLPGRVQLSFQGVTNYGLLGAAWMRWDTVPHTPLGAGVEITTQPGANAEPGVRLLFEAGRRLGRYVTITLRGGYGARREDAGGFSGGGSFQLAF